MALEVIAVVMAVILAVALMTDRRRGAAMGDTTRSESERLRVERELTAEALNARVDTFQQH